MDNNHYNQSAVPTKKLVWGGLAALSALLVLFAFLWIKSHGFITVSVSGVSSGKVEFDLTNQASGAKQVVMASSGHAKVLAQAGNYQITATQNGKSFFAVTKNNGFLSTTAVAGTAGGENARSFVGNNPSRCMDYTGSILLSFDCGSTLNRLKMHEPASASLPTRTKAGPADATNITTVGTVQTAEGNLMLVRISGGLGVYRIYHVQDDGTLVQGPILSALKPNTSYQVRPYRDGFIVFSDGLESGFKDIFYYTSSALQPTKLTLNTGLGSDFAYYTYGVNGSALAVAYSNQEESASPYGLASKKPEYKLAYFNGSGTQVFDMSSAYGNVTPCGTDRICAFGNKTLDVLAPSGKKLVRLYSIKNVLDAQAVDKYLLVFLQNQVVRLDVNAQNGFYSYSTGDYNYCGFAPARAGYLLCLTNSVGKKVTLLLSTGAPDTDSIDKKVAELLKSSDIKDVSAYGKYIYISPNLGPIEYDPTTGSFNYNQTTRKAVNASVDALIGKLNIDTSKYTIVNPYKY